MFNLKKDIHNALDKDDIKTVLSLSKENRMVLGLLIRLGYDKETLTGWRAIKAIGSVAREALKTDYDFLRETCRKLLWSLSDESGGIGWSAPEILGEIVSADPERFSDIIPLIAEIFDIEEKVFRPGVVYALLRIAENTPEKVFPYENLIIDALKDDDPQTQVFALELVGRLLKMTASGGTHKIIDKKDLIDTMNNLKNSQKVAWIYQNGDFKSIEVGEMAENILNNINNDN